MNNRNSPNQLPNKCPWILRVGVFFDGTGNNKENDLIKGKGSNIAKLWGRYKVEDNTEQLIRLSRIYKNGVGTVDGEDNEIDGIAKGDGGIERIHEAIKEVAEFFDTKPCAKEFIVDVFGFSRGAAQARHFINELHDRAAGPDVKVGFVGLYDTVASFSGSWMGILGFEEDQPGDNINIAEWEVQQGTRKVRRGGRIIEVPYYKEFIQPYNFHLSSASAEHIEHFVAKDEVRKNFPLSSLEPNDGGFLKEQTFIGVHSDIGGGYGPENKYENKLEWIAQYRPRHGRTANAMDRINPEQSRAYQREDRFSRDEIDNIRQEYEALGYNVEEKTINLRVWLVGKKTVDNELAKVYLLLMYNRALMKHVPFDDLPDDNIYQLKDIKNDKGEVVKRLDTLRKYASTLLAKEQILQDEQLEIYTKHIHQSDVDDEDRASVFNTRQHFTDRGNEPDDDHVRTIFPNNSSFAIVPEENDNPNAEGAEIDTDNLASRNPDG